MNDSSTAHDKARVLLRFAQATPYEQKFGVNVWYWAGPEYIGSIYGAGKNNNRHFRGTLMLLGDKLVLHNVQGAKVDVPVDFNGAFIYRNDTEEFMWKGLMWKFAEVDETTDE